MAKKTSRGHKQDRARVAGGQNYEVAYEAKKESGSEASHEESGPEPKEGRARSPASQAVALAQAGDADTKPSLERRSRTIKTQAN